MNTNVVIGSAAAVVIIAGLLYLGSFTRPQEQADQSGIEATREELTLNEEFSELPMPELKEDITPIKEDVSVTLKTNKGDIVMTLHGANAPVTVANFVQLAESDFFDGTAFHRVIADFMIQGGDPYSKDPDNPLIGTGDPGYKFKDEINDQKLVRGSVAMANAGPNTNGSQFFIVTAESTPWLDGMHTNFGEVTAGMETVDLISASQTDEAGKPVEPIVIEDVLVVR